MESAKENNYLLTSPEMPVAALPLRSYFDQHILPHLAPALSLVAKERPENPIVFLANHLLKASPAAAAASAVATETEATKEN